MRTERQAGAFSPSCVRFMHFVQRTYNKLNVKDYMTAFSLGSTYFAVSLCTTELQL